MTAEDLDLRSSRNSGHALEIVRRAIGETEDVSSAAETIDSILRAILEVHDADGVRLTSSSGAEAHVDHIAGVFPPHTRDVTLYSSTVAGDQVTVEVLGKADADGAGSATVALLDLLSARLGAFSGTYRTDVLADAFSELLTDIDDPDRLREIAVEWLGKTLAAEFVALEEIVPLETNFPDRQPDTTIWMTQDTCPGDDLRGNDSLPFYDQTSSGTLHARLIIETRPDVILSVGRPSEGEDWCAAWQPAIDVLVPVLHRHLDRAIHAWRAAIRAQHLRTLQKITTRSTATRNLEDLGRMVQGAIEDLISSDVVVIAMQTPDQGFMSVYRAEGDQIYPPRPAIDLFVHMLNSGRSSMVSDIPAEFAAPHNRFGDPDSRVRSLLAAPMIADGKPIGLLTAQRYDPRAYRWKHAELLALIAQSVTGAFERHILLDQLSRQTRRDTDLRFVAERLTGTLDTAELLSLATRSILETAPAHLVVVLLVERRTLRVKMRAHHAASAAFTPQPVDGRLDPKSLSHAALESMEQIAVAGEELTRYATFKEPRWARFESAAATPVIVDEDRTGLLVVMREDARGFSEDDLSIQRQIAALLAGALQNATAYAHRLRHVNDLTELNRITSTIASQLDLEKSLVEIIEAARTLVGADGCAVGLLDGNDLVVVGAVGTVANLIPERVPVEGMLFQRVIETGQPVAIHDLGAAGAGRTSVPLSVARGWTAVPLLAPESEVLGVIGVFTTEPRVWSERDQSLLAALGASSALAILNARHFESTRDLLQASVESLAAAIEAKDPKARNHSRQVARYARVIAEELGFDAEAAGQIELAGLLHDVGKIGIPDTVLEKTETLDAADWAAIHLHPVLGEQILSGNPILHALLPLVRHHHERWDGYGYPDQLKQDEIPTGSTIIAVAEAVDTITSHQPYHPARPWETVVTEIVAGRGTQFAPAAVDAFLRGIEKGAFSEDWPDSDGWKPDRDHWPEARDPVLDVRALHILEGVAREISTGSSLEEFLPNVLALLRDVLNVPYIALYVRKDQDFSLIVSSPDVPDPVELTAAIAEGRGIVAWVARHGELQNVADVKHDERYVDGWSRGTINSELCVPLFADGEVIGVLNVESDQPAAFSSMDERLLMSTADHIANAIQVMRLHDRLKSLSNTDALTGLHNHRSFFEYLVTYTRQSIAEGQPLTIAILDVDDLKTINDTYGHLVGDAALREVAGVLKRKQRDSDIVCRYGGDEFAMILPGTPADAAWTLLEEIHTELETGSYEAEGLELPLPTASWGTASCPDDGRRPAELLGLADQRMYRSKPRQAL